jgi:hypothetical protein
MDVEQLRTELRAVAAAGGVPHVERMAGVGRRVRRARAVRVAVPVAVLLAAVLLVPLVGVVGDRFPVVPAGYDGSYPGPETFDRLAVDGTCPRGGQPGSGTEVPVGPGEVVAGEATALGGPLVAAVREAGADVEVGSVERSATSLTQGAPPCGPSYTVFLSGDDGATQLLLTVSWAGDDRFSGLLRCTDGVPAEACEQRSADGWSGTLQAAPGGMLLVLLHAEDGATPAPTTPVVAVRQPQGDPLGGDALAQIAVAQDWHRLAEQVEAGIAP